MKKIAVLTVTLVLVLAMSVPALAAYKEVINPTLDTWCAAYSLYLAQYMKAGKLDGMDYIAPGSTITYDPNQVRVSSDGKKVADGGAISKQGTFNFGMGAGVTDDSLWYLSFTYDKRTDTSDMIMSAKIAVACAQFIGYGFDEGQAGLQEQQEVLKVLFNGSESVAIEDNGIVIFSKYLPDNKIIIGINSLPFYNAFYKGTIEQYFTLK